MGCTVGWAFGLPISPFVARFFISYAKMSARLPTWQTRGPSHQSASGLRLGCGRVERLLCVRIVSEVPDLDIHLAVGVFHHCIFARLERLDRPYLVQIGIDLLAENLHL